MISVIPELHAACVLAQPMHAPFSYAPLCVGRMAAHHAIQKGHVKAAQLLIRAGTAQARACMRRAELHDGRNLLLLQFQAMYHCTSEREGTAELTALASASATTLNHCNKLGASPLSIAVKVKRPSLPVLSLHAHSQVLRAAKVLHLINRSLSALSTKVVCVPTSAGRTCTCPPGNSLRQAAFRVDVSNCLLSLCCAVADGGPALGSAHPAALCGAGAGAAERGQGRPVHAFGLRHRAWSMAADGDAVGSMQVGDSHAVHPDQARCAADLACLLAALFGQAMCSQAISALARSPSKKQSANFAGFMCSHG